MLLLGIAIRQPDAPIISNASFNTSGLYAILLAAWGVFYFATAVLAVFYLAGTDHRFKPAAGRLIVDICTSSVQVVVYAGLLLRGWALTQTAEGTPTLTDSVYFSIVTFTTLGYGEIVPVPSARLAVSLIAALGVVHLSLLAGAFFYAIEAAAAAASAGTAPANKAALASCEAAEASHRAAKFAVAAAAHAQASPHADTVASAGKAIKAASEAAGQAVLAAKAAEEVAALAAERMQQASLAAQGAVDANSIKADAAAAAAKLAAQAADRASAAASEGSAAADALEEQ
jgi:hypothetical protein